MMNRLMMMNYSLKVALKSLEGNIFGYIAVNLGYTCR